MHEDRFLEHNVLKHLRRKSHINEVPWSKKCSYMKALQEGMRTLLVPESPVTIPGNTHNRHKSVYKSKSDIPTKIWHFLGSSCITRAFPSTERTLQLIHFSLFLYFVEGSGRYLLSIL